MFMEQKRKRKKNRRSKARVIAMTIFNATAFVQKQVMPLNVNASHQQTVMLTTYNDTRIHILYNVLSYAHRVRAFALFINALVSIVDYNSFQYYLILCRARASISSVLYIRTMYRYIKYMYYVRERMRYKFHISCVSV